MDIIVNDFYGLDMATTKEYGFGGDALLLAEFASRNSKTPFSTFAPAAELFP